MKEIRKSIKFVSNFMKKYFVSLLFVLMFIFISTYLNIHAPKYMGEAIDKLIQPMSVELVDKDGKKVKTEVSGYVVESIKYDTFSKIIKEIEDGNGLSTETKKIIESSNSDDLKKLLDIDNAELKKQFDFLMEFKRIVDINEEALDAGFDTDQKDAIKNSKVFTQSQKNALTFTDADFINQLSANGIPKFLATEMLKDPKTNMPADMYKGYQATKDMQSTDNINNLYSTAKQFDLDEQRQEAAYDKFKGSLFLLILAYVFTAVSGYMYSILMARTSAKTVRDMRISMFNKIEKLSIRFFDNHSDGDLLSRFVNDMDNISTALNQSFTQAISQVALLFGVIYMMFSEDKTSYVFSNGFEIHNLLAWLMMIFAFIAIVGSRIVIIKAQKYVTVQQQKLGNLNGFIDEQINGQKTIIAYGQQGKSLSGFEDVNLDLRETSFKGQMYSNILMPLVQGVGFINLGTLVFLGSMLIANGSDVVSVGLIVAFIQYSQRFFNPLASILSQYNLLQLGFTGVERVAEVFEVEPEITDENSQGDIDGISGTVHINDVSFSYVEGKEILSHVDIKVSKGQTVALVGPTGSGKTTVMNLMNRFYDVTDGAILIDNQDIRSISISSLRKNVGIVLQESIIFKGTIFDNIAYGKDDATLEEVVEVAKLANIDTFIDSLEDGYYTEVDNNSSLLSIGQKQMISIARTILTDPDLLILDEATSNVDTITEEKIQKAMKNALDGRTSFVIAHRLKTILDADIIVVLKDGEVIEQGNHQELLKLDGFYAELYKNQFVIE